MLTCEAVGKTCYRMIDNLDNSLTWGGPQQLRDAAKTCGVGGG